MAFGKQLTSEEILAQRYKDNLSNNRRFYSAAQLLADASPKVRAAYESVLPVFKAYQQQQAASGQSLRIPTQYLAGYEKAYKAQYDKESNFGKKDVPWISSSAVSGRDFATDADELAWNWLYEKVNAGDTAKADELTPQAAMEWLSNKYMPDRSWWDQKGAPGLSIALNIASMIPGLNPLGTIAGSIGSALGSKLAGQAVAGALGSAITGGDPLKGALSGVAGGLTNKLGSAVSGIMPGRAGEFASTAFTGAANAALSGADPIQGAISGTAGKASGLFSNNISKGVSDMSSGNRIFGDIINKGITGALGALSTGGNAGSAALSSVGKSLLGNITGGTLDDSLRATLGLDKLNFNLPGDIEKTGKVITDLGGGTLDDKLRESLYGVINDKWNINLGGTAGGTQPQTQQSYGTIPDLMTLYQQYLDRVQPQQSNLEDALMRQYSAAKETLKRDYEQQLKTLDADMNRRGLFSSGLAARRQDDFTNNYFSALSNAANSMALNLEQDRVAQETARQKQALEFATETYKQLLTNAYGAGPAVQMYTPPATQTQPTTNNAATVFKNILDQARTLPGRPVVDPGYYVNKQQVYGPLLGNSATASGATAAAQSSLLNGIKKANPRRLLFGGGRSGSTTLV